MKTGTGGKISSATLKAMLKPRRKGEPKFKVNEKVIVHIHSDLFRVGTVTDIKSSREITYTYHKESIDRGWLRPDCLEEKVNEAEELYEGPWAYQVTYTDNFRGAAAQWNKASDVKKFTGLYKTLYAR